ncbi:TIGR03668 family PPOX class F420-dependent oxidoreductase [soil metagenome]
MPRLPATAMRRRVEAARVGRLATVSSDGRPHLVPVVFALSGDTLVTAVDAKPKSGGRLRRLDNIRANPRVTVLVDHYDEDWSRLWWIRLDGEARILADPASTRGPLALLTGKYGQYRRQPPQGPVVSIRLRGWRGWAAQG